MAKRIYAVYLKRCDLVMVTADSKEAAEDFAGTRLDWSDERIGRDSNVEVEALLCEEYGADDVDDSVIAPETYEPRRCEPC
jgi:hypothetical protein